MLVRKSLLLAAILGSGVQAAPADTYIDISARGDSICYHGIYGALQVLSNYPPAQSFCAAKFPVKCVQKAKRSVAGTTTTATGKATVATTQATTKTTILSAKAQVTTQNAVNGDPKAYHMSILRNMAYSSISTLCSCIQPAKVILLLYTYIQHS